MERIPEGPENFRQSVQLTLQGGQGSFWAGVGFYVVRYIYQHTLFVDYKVAADNAHIGLAKVGLFLPRPIQLGNCVVCIHQQCEGQVVLLAELLVALLPVWTDAEDNSILFGDRSVALAEPASLDRSARGVIFRIEIEDDFLALIVG